MPIKTEDFERVTVASEAALWAWLADHHAQEQSVWLVTWMKGVPDKYISRDMVLDALVAHGWIDGIRRKLDAERTMQLISPRKQQAWAQSYKDRAERLVAEGRMHPAGQKSLEAGKSNGLWDFFADVDALIVPDDLAASLGDARSLWQDLPPAYQRNVLRWIKLAKTEPTRAKRITAATEATQTGVRLPQM